MVTNRNNSPQHRGPQSNSNGVAVSPGNADINTQHKASAPATAKSGGGGGRRPDATTDTTSSGGSTGAGSSQEPKSCFQTVKTNIVSVRVATTLLCALLILVTAAVVIAVTTQYALNAAKEITKDQVSLISAKSKGDIETNLMLPLRYSKTWQYLLSQNNHSLPSDLPSGEARTAMYDAWIQMLMTPMVGSDFQFQYSVIGFEDGNYIGCKNAPNEMFTCSKYEWGDRDVTNTSGVSHVTHTTYHRTNYSLVGVEEVTTTYDPRTRFWYSQVNHTPNAIRWSDVYLSAIPTLPIADVNVALFNASGAFLGVASLTYELSAISDFLSEILTSKETTLIVIDNQGLLVASSYSSPYLTYTSVDVPYTETVPSNCLLSDSANDATSNVMVCRASASSYAFKPLQEVAQGMPSVLESSTTEAFEKKLDGTDYFVSVIKLSTAGSDNMRWRVLLFLPSSLINEGIISGRNISILICIGVVAFTLVVCLVIVTLLLRPLHTLSQRMYRVATMQDIDDESEEDVFTPNSVSMFQEIATIQLAFGSLTTELSKVKSFLPQSVLQELYGVNMTSSSDPREDAEAELADEGFGMDDSGCSSRSNRLSFFQTGDTVESTKTIATSSSRLDDSSTLMWQTGNPFATSAHSSSSGGGIGSPLHGAGVARVAASNAHLNTGIGLKSKKVTVLMINMCDYHQQLQQHTLNEIAIGHSKIVKMIGDSCKEHRGVLDGFQGDRFVVSFNAVTTVANHALHAAKVCASITEKFSGSRMAVSCGVGTGQAMVGNVGSHTTKRFTVLSPIVSNAAALERLCKIFVDPYRSNVTTLLGQTSCADVENFFELMTVDGVVLPSTTSTFKKLRVAMLMEYKKTNPGEWMYQLQENSVKSEYSAINIAFEHLLKGDWSAAINVATAALRKTSLHSEGGYLTATASVVVPALNPLSEPPTPPTSSAGIGSALFTGRNTTVVANSRSSCSRGKSHRVMTGSFGDKTEMKSPSSLDRFNNIGVDILSATSQPTPADALQDLIRKLLQGIVTSANLTIQRLKVSDVTVEQAESLVESSSSRSSMYNTGTAATNNPANSSTSAVAAVTAANLISASRVGDATFLSFLGITDDYYAKCVLPALQAPMGSPTNKERKVSRSGGVGGLRSRSTSRQHTPKNFNTKPFRSLADVDYEKDSPAPVDEFSKSDGDLQEIASKFGL